MQRRSGAQFGVLFLDLDGFKLINDSLGHQTGDRVLTAVGDRIGAELREVDTGARFGGDEFAILLHDTDPHRCTGRRPPRSGRAGTPPRPRRIRRLDQGQHGHRDQRRRVRVRRGHPARCRHRHVPREDRRTGNDRVLRRGDARRRRAAPDPAREIRLALEKHEFEVFYQPIVNLASGRTDRFEALVRWRHPDRGLVMPDGFLPVMEETGLIVGLGHWILDEVCRQLAEWGPRVVNVSINLSDREFWHRGLLPHVLDVVHRHGLTPERLTLEVTEGVLMRHPGDGVAHDARDARGGPAPAHRRLRHRVLLPGDPAPVPGRRVQDRSFVPAQPGHRRPHQPS